MDEYNFWQDFFDTYQSLSDWMKFAWLVVPLAFGLGLFAIFLRYRLEAKREGEDITGELIYTISRDDFGQLHIYRHGPQVEQHTPILLLEDNLTDPVDAQTRGRRT